MTPHDYILQLVQTAFDHLDSTSSTLGSCLRKAARIARLRNDFISLWWLEQEMISFRDQMARRRVLREIMSHLTKDQYDYLVRKHGDEYCEERHLPGDENTICHLGVEEIEAQIQHFERVHSATRTPEGMLPFDQAAFHDSDTKMRNQASHLIANLRAVLARIRQRVCEFLGIAEQQLVFGQVNADIFEQNRQYVDRLLLSFCPDGLKMFKSAVERVAAGDPEARSHALTSCRRIIKETADRVYPPTPNAILGPDGKERTLTEDKYIARLWQFVAERCYAKTAGKVLLVNLEDTGRRIDALYELACKGVHDQISVFEMNQCVIQTYLLVGDILRIQEETSAVGKEDDTAT